MACCRRDVTLCVWRLLADRSGRRDEKKEVGFRDFRLCLLQWPALARELINHDSKFGVVVVDTISRTTRGRRSRLEGRGFRKQSPGYKNESTCRCAATFETREPAVEGELLRKTDMSFLTL